MDLNCVCSGLRSILQPFRCSHTQLLNWLHLIPARRIVSAVYATATWLAGWYCIKTDKPTLKLLRPSGNSIILVSCDLAPMPNSKAKPFSGGVKYTGLEKLAIFVQFSTEIAVYLGNGAR